MSLKESADDVLQHGDTAPDFKLTGADGEVYTLNDFVDRAAVLIVFTCNHCPYAKAKIPALNALAAEFEDVAVIGINSNDADEYPDDSFDAMQELVDQGVIQYDAYLWDEEQTVAASYGAVCTPDSFLFVKQDGAFRLMYHGRLDDAMNPDDDPSGEPGFEMREAIRSVLAGEPVGEELPSQGCSIKWKAGNEPEWW